jgi:hypothetical protein
MTEKKPRLKLSGATPAVPAQNAFLSPTSAYADIRPTTSALTRADRWDHILARLGYRRMQHRVAPGLYALGKPKATSPVLVTANYRLSFDALRSALPGRDAHILVLDTQGVNVWCAAGEGTFGTEELVNRIGATGLARVVSHRRLVLPQLGAPGVAAHVVRQRSGFRVEYGPVRAADLPAYLDKGKATPEMRAVRFPLRDRVVLAPMELVQSFLPMLGIAVVLYLCLGLWGAVGAVAAVWAGALLFPILLPWLPTREFTAKGLILGAPIALAVAYAVWHAAQGPSAAPWPALARWAGPLGLLLGMPAVTAYLALNFTGATPITSQSGVAREMRKYLRVLVGMAGLGAISIIAAGVSRLMGA